LSRVSMWIWSLLGRLEFVLFEMLCSGDMLWG
jgi:hypothetical protein